MGHSLMLEIPTNVIIERMKTFMSEQEVPDDWKAIPAITEIQAKVYRAKVTLLEFKGPYQYTTLRIEGVVPVYAGNRCIGCLGEVDVNGEAIVVELIIDYATPERLELENGTIKIDPVIVADLHEGQPCYGSDLLKRVNLKL